MRAVGIALLGPLAVDGDGKAFSPRDRVVLAALALRPGEMVSAERLADALWGEHPPVSWPKVVQGCVVRLRKALGPATIQTAQQGYRLVVHADDVDAQRFEGLVGRCRELLALGEAERASHMIGEALALWRGRPLAELEGWEPGRVEAGRLEELRLEAEELALEAALRAGRYRAVLAEAEARAAEAPLRERRWGLLALAQYQAGRQGDALRSLHRARTVLASELGVDPGPALVALEESILRHDPSLVAGVALPEPSTTCPYLGLVAYDVADAEGFFGRDGEVVAGLRRLAAVGVLAVVGPSGSGKSSLLRAGVAAALKRDHRQVVVVTPGAHPTEALAVLPAAGPAPVLVVDQVEEAITLCDDSGEQARFFAALAAHAGRGLLVVAMRADRLGELAAHPGFARLIEPGLYLLGAMAETDLRVAIEGPARQAGLLLEPGLVELLIRDVQGEPGALPLLSHALRTTWQQREGRTLTVAGYLDTGGIRGAVAQTAEELYEQVPADQRPGLRDLLLRLVAPSPDGEPVRTRVPRRLVATDAAHERLIELLVSARLVTSDDDVVVLAHEALARAWPRLRGWLDEDVEGQRILRHVTVAADNWEAMGRPDSELYRGVRLAQVLDWRQRARPDLTATERAFLDAGQALADTERQTAEDRARHQVRINRRLRGLLAGVAVLLVVAVVAGVAAVRQRDRAQESAADAEVSAVVAEARRIGTQALTIDDLDQSLLLSVEGRRLHDSNDTRASLFASLNRSPQAVGIIRSAGPRWQDLAVTGDGRYLAVRDNAGGLYFFDATTREPVAQVVDENTFVATLTATPDSRGIAAVIQDPNTGQGMLRFFDAATGKETRDPLQVTEAAWSVAISDNGRFAAISSVGPSSPDTPSVATIWDLQAPASPPRRVVLDLERWPGLHFTPDGRLVVAGFGLSRDPATGAVVVDPATSAVILDPATGTVTATVPGAHAQGAVSPDGSTLVAGLGAGLNALPGDRLGVFDLATGELRRELTGHSDTIIGLAFSPDGRSVASASDDRTVMVWDPKTGERTAVLEGHNGRVVGVGFSADGRTLYSSSLDGSVIAWDLAGDERLVRQLAPPVRPRSPSRNLRISPSPDGATLSYSYLGDPASPEFVLRDLATGRFHDAHPTGHPTLTWQDWTPDGRHLVTTGQDNMVRLWDPVTGRPVAEHALGSIANSIGWRPGGETIFLGLDAGEVVELDAATLDPVHEPLRFDHPIVNLDVSPNGRLLAVALDEHCDSCSPTAAEQAYPPTVAMVDNRSREVLGTIDDVDADNVLTFSPDGSRLAAAGNEGIITLIDTASRQRAGAPLRVQDGFVKSLSFSPDGHQLVGAGTDGTVALWDVTRGQRVGRVTPGKPNTWIFAWFAPDGHTIVATNESGGIWQFDTRPDQWQRHACQVAGRNLNQDEWHELIPGRPYHRTCPEYPAGT
jgi:WD40 repeat protein/DNA-binding SARP family transcriptional activator